MKRYILIFLAWLPLLGGAQTREEIDKVIDNIAKEIATTYFSEYRDSFPENKKSASSIYEYSYRYFGNNAKHPVPKSILDLMQIARNFDEKVHDRNYVRSEVDKHIRLNIKDITGFKARIYSIINTLEVKNSADIVEVNPPNQLVGDDSIRSKNEEYVTLKEDMDENYEKTKRYITYLENQRDEIKTENAELKTRIQEQSIKINDLEVKQQGENNYQLLWLLVPTFILGYYANVLLRRKSKKKNKSQKRKVLAKPKPTATIENTKPVMHQSTPTTVNSPSKLGEWLIVHASEVGKSHLISNPPVPCQDNHAILALEDNWGIAVSCDGAGSAKLSHEGSEFISEEAIKLFQRIIKENDWIKTSRLPKEEDWEKICLKAFKKLRYDLEVYAKAKKVPVSELASTIIVVVYSPIGLLSAHIGDGKSWVS